MGWLLPASAIATAFLGTVPPTRLYCELARGERGSRVAACYEEQGRACGRAPWECEGREWERGESDGTVLLGRWSKASSRSLRALRPGSGVPGPRRAAAAHQLGRPRAASTPTRPEQVLPLSWRAKWTFPMFILLLNKFVENICCVRLWCPSFLQESHFQKLVHFKGMAGIR